MLLRFSPSRELRKWIDRMAKSLKAGNKVRWKTSQGETSGTVVRKQTSPTRIKRHKVAASKTAPQFVVQSDKSGDLAAHKASALRRTARKGRG
jgi:hypothetical protein